jgi:hypothetical protein
MIRQLKKFQNFSKLLDGKKIKQSLVDKRNVSLSPLIAQNLYPQLSLVLSRTNDIQ